MQEKVDFVVYGKCHWAEM